MVGVILGLTFSTLVTSTGCNFVPKSSSLRWPWSKEKKKPLPDRIVPVWTDTVLHQPNQPGVRGFGGRVYFYLKDGSDPIEIDGGLAIYVFDADNEAYDQKPLRKFAFTPEQFANQMSKTSIGPSYSIWLPWGEVGGPPRRLSLIARFEGTEGGTVISDPTIKLLPGVISKKENPSAAPGQSSAGSPLQLTGHASSPDATAAAGVNQAAYSASNEGATPSAEQLRNRNRTIGTIDLPPSFQRHLYHNPKSRSAAGGAQATEPSQVQGTTDPTAADSSSAQGSSSLGTSAGRESLPETSVTATPITTQVIDHRSRTQRASQLQPANHTVTGEKSKTDIRTGRWIEAPSRTRQP
jgi:hypothetical protein